MMAGLFVKEKKKKGKEKKKEKQKEEKKKNSHRIRQLPAIRSRFLMHINRPCKYDMKETRVIANDMMTLMMDKNVV